MLKRLALPLIVLTLAAATASAAEAKLSVSKEDTVGTLLSKQVGKKVSLKLTSGEEMGGVVRSVGDRLVHLGELTGNEYYDGAVDLEDVQAVVVRTK
jgi:hypothetical protein